MAKESSGGGLDELERLSQQFKKEDHDAAQMERQSTQHIKKVQSVLGELRAFSISVAIGQLQLVATPEMIEKVNALKGQKGTAELRKLIGNLANDMERRIDRIAVSNPDMKQFASSIKTLAILVGLLSSLE